MKKNYCKEAADRFDDAVRKAILEISEKGELIFDCLTEALDNLSELSGYVESFNPDFAETARNEGYNNAESKPLPYNWTHEDAAKLLNMSFLVFRSNRDTKDGYKNEANFRDMFETLYRVENLCGTFA